MRKSKSKKWKGKIKKEFDTRENEKIEGKKKKNTWIAKEKWKVKSKRRKEKRTNVKRKEKKKK